MNFRFAIDVHLLRSVRKGSNGNRDLPYIQMGKWDWFPGTGKKTSENGKGNFEMGLRCINH